MAWTTANVTISVVIIGDTHSRSLVIVIDAVSLFRDDEKHLFTTQGWGKTYEDVILKLKVQEV